MDAELRKKVTLDSDGSGDSDDEHSDAELPEDRAAAREELAAMTAQLSSRKGDHSGLYAMKFMQDGLVRKRTQAEEALADLEAELGSQSGSDSDGEVSGRREVGQRRGTRSGAVFKADEEWGEAAPPSIGIKSTKVDTAITVAMPASATNQKGGQKAKGPNKITKAQRAVEMDTEQVGNVGNAASEPSTDSKNAEVENPWLAASRSTIGLTPQIAMSKFTKKADKRVAKLQRAGRNNAPSEDASTPAPVAIIKVDAADETALPATVEGAGDRAGDVDSGTAGSGAGFKLNSVSCCGCEVAVRWSCYFHSPCIRAPPHRKVQRNNGCSSSVLLPGTTLWRKSLSKRRPHWLIAKLSRTRMSQSRDGTWHTPLHAASVRHLYALTLTLYLTTM
jgi:hypothetical protein